MPTRAGTYTHLTRDERCQIAALTSRGESAGAIASFLSRDRRTINRELARNGGAAAYSVERAELRAHSLRSAASCRAVKMTSEVVALIEEALSSEQWSPRQIWGWMKATQTVSVSHERIYQHIWADKHEGGVLWKNLRHGGKKYNKRKGKTAGRGLIPGRVDIEMRPAIVEEKSRIGDWEIDTVIGAKHKGAIVTAVDRASKYLVAQKVERKTAEAVTQALVDQFRPFADKVLTVTADNGKEFAGHATITQTLGAPVYFAKPYHSWERGLNEHTNGLIRQYLSKSRSFSTLSQDELDMIVAKINNRPREVLGFKSPKQVFLQTHPPPGALHP